MEALAEFPVREAAFWFGVGSGVAAFVAGAAVLMFAVAPAPKGEVDGRVVRRARGMRVARSVGQSVDRIVGL